MVIAVKSAYLHQSMMIVGANITERTINDIKIKNAKFSYDTALACLKIEVNGKTCLVPAANVAYMEPAEAAEVKEKSK